MSKRKPPERRRRPSARRPSAPPRSGEPETAQDSPAASSTPSKKTPRKRVSARRGAAKPAASEGPGGSQQGRASASREKAAPERTSRAVGRTSRVTPLPSLESVKPLSAQRIPPVREATPEPFVIAPPGVQVADDDWETVAEGGPLLESVRPPSTPPSVTPANNGKRVRRHNASVGHLTAHSRVVQEREEDVLGTARAVLGADYYYQQWGREGLRRVEQEVDDFGLNPHFEARVRPWLEALCRRYFRVELEGVEQLPRDGRALLVANRSGALPWDGIVLKEALRMAAPSLPALRWLAEDSVFYYPFLGVFMNRVGAVRACPENAERLLRQSSLVAVFPEGARGAGRLFRDRHRLQRFGRGGYVRLALRSQAPVVPVAIVGGEEAYPLLARSKVLGRLIGASYMPVTPTFPWLGPAGLMPAPAKWRVVVGEPIDLGGYGREGAEDSLVVHRLNEQIRSNLQTLVDRAVQRRRRPLF